MSAPATAPVSSCMYSQWMINEKYQVTAPEEDKRTKEDTKRYKHVPHKDKPAQVVAKRNARERRRVQAVNTAFARLRKAVPLENARGKRVSKVKTLQQAIEYIQALVQLLEQDRNYHVISHYYSHKFDEDFFNYNFSDEL
ncbi:protein atonal homolog 7-like [Tribolium madens]|uniref:protein atonal homolog 7-like n=1 Tax=Tribolium madens TaxID=41895 RepID=UPI001CF72446|nr:protein atonal homolog 7-like [Tribolium madens]